MKTMLQGVALAIAFVVGYQIIDWFAGVTAPVVGPLVIVALIGSLIWALVKLSKWEAR